jgi:hypothetical protein
MRKILLVLLAPIIFASCSSKSGEIYVVTDGTAPSIESPAEGVSKMTPSEGTSNDLYAFSVSVDDKAVPVKFKIGGKTYDINITQPGTYLLNMSSDTIIAGQFEYRTQIEEFRDKNLSAKQDSINKANDPLKTKSEVNLLPGKSEMLTLDNGCKIYATSQKAPESIQTKSTEKIPITYQLYTQKQYSKMFMDMLMEQLQKAEPEASPSTEGKK